MLFLRGKIEMENANGKMALSKRDADSSVAFPPNSLIFTVKLTLQLFVRTKLHVRDSSWIIKEFSSFLVERNLID